MENKILPQNLLSVNDFARLTGKTRQTVLNWVNDGKVKRVEYLGKRWIDKSTLKVTT
jgi:hypothetical protein